MRIYEEMFSSNFRDPNEKAHHEIPAHEARGDTPSNDELLVITADGEEDLEQLDSIDIQLT